MPSFAELRERAAKAKDASVHKLSSTRNKYTSTSSKHLDWDANHKRPPPSPQQQPGHARALSTASTKSPPPPPPSRPQAAASPAPPADRAPPLIRRETRPDPTPPYPPSPPPTRVATDKIDWANLSAADKAVLFSWLDEFFARQLHVTIPPCPDPPQATVKHMGRPVTPPKPPVLPVWSRPLLDPPAPSSSSAPPVLTLSYPPPTTHGSAALDLAHYFSAATHWDAPWYAASELAPPLQTAAPPAFTASWAQRGATKTISAGVLFADLSLCWYTVSFPTAASASADPNDPRAARYLPRPAAQDRAALLAAHATYGEAVAAFAERFAGTGQYCARGECWDLAHEALKAVRDDAPAHDPPGGTVLDGRWRGGDDRVRRGDVVEWCRARVGMGTGAYAVLGAPDHTAVVVRDSAAPLPGVGVADGRRVWLGVLEVVEQSVGSPPSRARYDLGAMQAGEVWVYRPIGMRAYVGAVLQPQWPEDTRTCVVP